MSTKLYWSSAIGNPTLGRLLLAFVNAQLLYSNSQEFRFSFEKLENSLVSERAIQTMQSIANIFRVEPNSAIQSKQLSFDENILSLNLVDSFKVIADHQRDNHVVLKLSEAGLQITSKLGKAFKGNNFGIVNLNQDTRRMLVGTNKTRRNQFSSLWLNSKTEIIFIVNSNSLSEKILLEHWADGSFVEEIEISLDEILVLFFNAKWVIGSANGIANVSLLGAGHTILFKSFFCHTFSMLREFGASSNVTVFSRNRVKKIVRTNMPNRILLNHYFKKVK